MSGSGGGNQTSTTTFTGNPQFEAMLGPYLQSVGQYVFGQGGGPGGPTLPFPQGLNQQVAGMTPMQNQALQNIGGLTGQAQNLTGLGANTLSQFASGKNLGPDSNPMLQAYYNAAAGPMIQQFQNATQPGLMAEAEQAGAFGGTGMQQAQSTAQYNLGQGLGTLGANIFEPAYMQGQQLQYGAAQALPGAAMSLYGPSQALYGAGAAQQAQQQTQLNTAYQNALSQQQWPFALLSEYGQALGMGLGSAGITNARQPTVGGKGGSLF